MRSDKGRVYLMGMVIVEGEGAVFGMNLGLCCIVVRERRTRPKLLYRGLVGAERSESTMRGHWSTPSGCVGTGCSYRAEWSLDDDTDLISFTIIANQTADRWTGIAFAPQPQMVHATAGASPSQKMWGGHAWQVHRARAYNGV